MAKQKTTMLPLASITNRFDVRTKLDDDRVLQLMGCYESGIELPPITVVELGQDTYAYVDGRHRGAARQYLNLEDVEAVILPNPIRSSGTWNEA